MSVVVDAVNGYSLKPFFLTGSVQEEYAHKARSSKLQQSSI